MTQSTKEILLSAGLALLTAIVGWAWVELSEQGKSAVRFEEAARNFESGYIAVIKKVDGNSNRLNQAEVSIGILDNEVSNVKRDIDKLEVRISR